MNVVDAIKTRRSVRSYSSQKPTTEDLTEVLEAARNAPSAVNKQPWKFICVRSADALLKLQDAYLREWFKTAPCVIVAVGLHSESWHRKSDNKDHADVDVAIAVDHMTLRAVELGLSTCWVCNFDVPIVRQALCLRDNEEPIALLPIGYASASDEAVPHARKPATEVYSFI